MNWSELSTTAKSAILSLGSAVLSAAVLAALQWLGAHVPVWTAALTAGGMSFASHRTLV